jgi:NAD(P)-dependent dehydrogenase (short-subunit alcohol dehydrogenase family)
MAVSRGTPPPQRANFRWFPAPRPGMSPEMKRPELVSQDELFRLDGKAALITGGYGGIGEAVCRALAGRGAKVAVTGHNGEKAAACAEALRSQGHEAFSAKFDVTSVAEIRRMVDEVAARFGRLDILVNCVGLNREEKAEEVTEEQFDHVIDVNLKGVMFQAQAAARHMIRQGGGGKQVHFGSVRSLLALRGAGSRPIAPPKAVWR